MKKLSMFVVALGASVFFFGCGHNSAMFTLGERFNVGIDPQNMAANVTWADGLNVVDVARENSGWDISIDNNVGLSYDAKTGKVTGVKGVRRVIGPQITGYLVDLAKDHPDMAKMYIEAVKNYWEYQAAAVSANNNTEK